MNSCIRPWSIGYTIYGRKEDDLEETTGIAFGMAGNSSAVSRSYWMCNKKAVKFSFLIVILVYSWAFFFSFLDYSYCDISENPPQFMVPGCSMFVFTSLSLTHTKYIFDSTCFWVWVNFCFLDFSCGRERERDMTPPYAPVIMVPIKL